MSHRTVILSSFEEYLASEDYPPEVRAEEELRHNERLSRFPYSVTLQVSYPELDFANRWCWQQFGPSDGDCLNRQSVYRVCDLDRSHSHAGKWMSYWLAKTGYDYGFCEWHFSERAERDRFHASVEQINWGAKYAL